VREDPSLALIGLDEDRELVPTESRCGVRGPQDGANPQGHRFQQIVAASVPKAVVDRLEIVEVEEHDRE